MRAGTAQKESNATGVSKHNCSDTDQLVADGRASGTSLSGIFQSNPTDVVEQHIGHRAEHQPELVGPPVAATGSIRVQVELLFFDPVLHVAARAVDIIVKLLCVCVERGDDEARVRAHGRMLRLDDNPAFAIPCGGCILELAKEPLFFTGLFEERFGLGHKVCAEGFEPGVFCKPYDVVHIIVIAPAQHFPAAEAAVAPEDDLHLRPLCAKPFGDQR